MLIFKLYYYDIFFANLFSTVKILVGFKIVPFIYDKS